MEEKRKKIFGIEKNVFFLGIVSFFNDISSEMILSAFPAFFASALKAGAASLGIVEGVADGVAQFIKMFSGNFVDKVKRHRLFTIIGYIISIATRPFYSLANHVGDAFALRAIDRAGKGFREPSRDALISLSVPRKELGKSFGYHRTVDTLGAIIGPLITFFIIKNFPGNWTMIFMTSFLIGLLALASFVFIREAPKFKEDAQTILRYTNINQKSVYLAFLLLSLGTLPTAVLLLRVIGAGFDISYIPLFYLIYSVCFSIFAFSAGKLADGIGTRKVLNLGYLFLLIAYIFLAFDGILGLVFGFLSLGLFSAFTDGTMRAFISKHSDRDHRGSAIGLLSGINGLGLIGAGALGGFLWEHFSPTMAVAVSAVFVLFGLIILTASKGNNIANISNK